ncbi:MAG: tRNA lysidine(34) synthetase TilS [Flavobacterium sp.]
MKLKEAHIAFLRDTKCLLALSGGVDSMVLAHLLLKQSITFSVAHANFQLRGSDSEADQTLVEDFCNQHQIPCFVQRFDTLTYAEQQGISIQMAARELRYQWFEMVMQENDLELLLTAHHADDSLETFFINLGRGTGIKGLLGIPEQNDKIFRPLLAFSKDEILHYAEVKPIAFREDSSNAKTNYQRNWFRHQIIPLLKENQPDFLNQALQTMQHLQAVQQFAEGMVQNQLQFLLQCEGENIQSLPINLLKAIPGFQYVLHVWLAPFGFTAWDDIYQMLDAYSGKTIYSKNFRLLKNRDQLLLQPLTLHEEEEVYEVTASSLNLPIDLHWKECTVIPTEFKADASVVYLDKDSLNLPLQLRRWQKGDYFYPFGMQGKKKLSKFFKDEKFSIIDKENAWVLCSDNQIVWVVGHRMDNRFKITSKTKHIVQLTLMSNTK